MLIKTLKRFNGKPAGAVLDADDKDAKKWIAMGLVEEAEDKEVEGPDQNRLAKKAVKK